MQNKANSNPILSAIALAKADSKAKKSAKSVVNNSIFFVSEPVRRLVRHSLGDGGSFTRRRIILSKGLSLFETTIPLCLLSSEIRPKIRQTVDNILYLLINAQNALIFAQNAHAFVKKCAELRIFVNF